METCTHCQESFEENQGSQTGCDGWVCESCQGNIGYHHCLCCDETFHTDDLRSTEIRMESRSFFLEVGDYVCYK